MNECIISNILDLIEFAGEDEVANLLSGFAHRSVKLRILPEKILLTSKNVKS